jgi:hypothetical protein
MDVRIGVSQSPREIEVEIADGSDVEALVNRIEDVLSREGSVLWLTDRRGRRVGVPSAKVAYVELDAAGDERRVGFGAVIK